MGVTANHIISDIRDIASSGSEPVDFRISDENILYWINQVRSMLIVQAIQKRQIFSDTWIQTIGCVELEQVDKSECCGVQTNCYFLRSKLEIPDTIENDDNNLILSVHGLDGTPITKNNQFRYKYKKFNKFTGKTKGWFLKDNYLYIINDDLLSTVSLTGVFEDPSDLARFNCESNTCWSIDSDYPVSLKMASTIADIVVKTKIVPFMSFPQDNKNDAANLPDGQQDLKAVTKS